MRYVVERVLYSSKKLDAARRSRSAPRAGDPVCPVESREYASGFCACALHARSSPTTGAHAGVEWTTRSPDLFYGLRIPDYIHNVAKVGKTLGCEYPRLLPFALC